MSLSRVCRRDGNDEQTRRIHFIPPASPSSQAESTRSRTDALTERRIREQRKSANSDGPFGFLPDSKQKFHDGAFLAITGRWQHFLYGGGSFRPRPAIACCAHAGRDTFRTAR